MVLKKYTLDIWDKAFKNGPSKICGRHALQILKGYGLLKQTKFFVQFFVQRLPVTKFTQSTLEYLSHIIFNNSYCRHNLNKIVRKFRNFYLADYKSFIKTCKISNVQLIFHRNIVWVGSPQSSQANMRGRIFSKVTGQQAYCIEFAFVQRQLIILAQFF